ncbi:MAG: hypothetical protein CVU19_03575 [Betaproteobacteria bacterium HGW-Betaproteobacteria-13]|jgi:hypothetical protein|nr:MAG: hypothetical protein CVU19_03575 [Betaproteobacteria bacterium HGW-Betaproteobacteria-13]
MTLSLAPLFQQRIGIQQAVKIRAVAFLHELLGQSADLELWQQLQFRGDDCISCATLAEVAAESSEGIEVFCNQDGSIGPRIQILIWQTKCKGNPEGPIIRFDEYCGRSKE